MNKQAISTGRLFVSTLGRFLRLRYLLFEAALLLAVAFVAGARAFPTSVMKWLSIRNGTGTSQQASDYYAAINAPATLDAWLTIYGFKDGGDDAHAKYYNASDLGFGRDMHCRHVLIFNAIACYVVNYGFGPGSPPEPAIAATITEQEPLATVAMVYSKSLPENEVRFYVYDQDGKLLNGLSLDSEEPKYVPQLCLSCHGGVYNAETRSVTFANFLPFDAPSFKYSQTDARYTLDAQQEQFRKLNAIVLATQPIEPIAELIDGWYRDTGGVDQAGSRLNDEFVPDGYQDNPALYATVVKPYCRMCHVAQIDTPLTTLEDQAWARARLAVYTGYYMPHAEQTAHNFWTSSAPAALANAIPGDQTPKLRVTTTDDADDGACDDHCTLREAIRAANQAADKDVITFAVDGTFRLGSIYDDDAALGGDLDITTNVIILGNGADKTIIDGNGLDRVFHILSGADVVIQGVTIQGGRATRGGGLYVDGIKPNAESASSKLTLNLSVLNGNIADTYGGALANQDGATTEINQSLIGPGNDAIFGGGISNQGSTLTIQNSTLSGNRSSSGGGIYNSRNIYGDGVVTITHSTITGNSADSTLSGGGGIRTSEGTTQIKNSIVAGNRAQRFADCENDDATFTSRGYNLVGQHGASGGCPTAASDRVLAGAIGTAISTALVQREAIPYHDLVRGSPAIDTIPAGSSCQTPSYDQRNVARPLDGNGDNQPTCDIGAFEYQGYWRYLPAVTR